MTELGQIISGGGLLLVSKWLLHFSCEAPKHTKYLTYMQSKNDGWNRKIKLVVRSQQISNTTDHKMYYYFNKRSIGKNAAN